MIRFFLLAFFALVTVLVSALLFAVVFWLVVKILRAAVPEKFAPSPAREKDEK